MVLGAGSTAEPLHVATFICSDNNIQYTEQRKYLFFPKELILVHIHFVHPVT